MWASEFWFEPTQTSWVCLICGGVQELDIDELPTSCEVGFHQKQDFIREPVQLKED